MTLVISGGRVQIEDGIKKTEDYAPPRKALVEIRFEVPEGADGAAMSHAAAEQAQATLSFALSGVASAASSKPAAPAAAPAKRGPKPKDAPEPGSKAALEAQALLDAQTPAAAKVVPAASDEENIDDLLGDTAPTPVTDAELGKAAQDKNAKMKAEHGEKWAPAKLRELITEYAGTGKRINDIPASKRHEFIEKLKALTI